MRALVATAAAVVCLVALVALGGAFVPAQIGTPAAYASGAGAAQLQAGLAEAGSYQAQLAAAAKGPAPTAEAAGASLEAQIASWSPGPYLATVQADLLAMARSLAATGAIPAALSSQASADLAQAKAWATSAEGRWDVTSLVALARRAGFSPAGAAMAAAVAMAESGGNPTEVDHDSNGTADYGLWQINWPTHAGAGGATVAPQLFVPATNALAAFQISGGGRDWRPWVTFDHGLEIPFLPQAEAAAGI